MTNKKFILDSLIDDDEAFTQILEYFALAAEIKISPLELKKMLLNVNFYKCLLISIVISLLTKKSYYEKYI